MLPQKPFYLIRHGETIHNAAEISAGGGLDSPLSEKGRAQPQELAPFLANLDVQPQIIHHSTMSRATDTARFLNEPLGLDMIPNRDLREHELGEMEGIPWEKCRPYFEERRPFPGGECISSFSQRIQSTITDILEASDDLPMIVAHGGLFHAIGFMYDYARMSSNNCHLHYFEPEPTYNDFPWRVWMFDIEGEELIKRPAPFCISHAMAA
jgi:probable phosphoglycerate mutase